MGSIGEDYAEWKRRAEVAEQELAAERERREEAENRRDHTAQWYAERLERLKQMAKERGFWPEMAAIIANGTATSQEPPTYAQQLNMAKHSAEQAERERAAIAEDLAAVRQSAEFFDRAANEERKRAEQAEQDRDEARAGEAAAFVAGKAEAREEIERAEADNAALLEAYRRTWSVVQHDNVLHSPACNASDDPLGICTPDCPALYVSNLLKADHPGAALLERLRALEKVREAVRKVDTFLDFSEPWAPDHEGPLDPVQLNEAARELVDACAAFDALKGTT